MRACAGAVSFIHEKNMAAQSTSALQDMFLKHLHDHRIEVADFPASGIRLQGQIGSFDHFTVQRLRRTRLILPSRMAQS
jgi:RNA chaperone Hfq